MTVEEAREVVFRIMGEFDADDVGPHERKAVDDLIAAVREDERQQMYELWKGILP